MEAKFTASGSETMPTKSVTDGALPSNLERGVLLDAVASISCGKCLDQGNFQRC